MENQPSNVYDLFQRRLFNYKLKWDNNDLEWLEVANKIFFEQEVELEVGDD